MYMETCLSKLHEKPGNNTGSTTEETTTIISCLDQCSPIWSLWPPWHSPVGFLAALSARKQPNLAFPYLTGSGCTSKELQKYHLCGWRGHPFRKSCYHHKKMIRLQHPKVLWLAPAPHVSCFVMTPVLKIPELPTCWTRLCYSKYLYLWLYLSFKDQCKTKYQNHSFPKLYETKWKQINTKPLT